MHSLGLSWLSVFRFRNNRKHRISISKGTLIHSENGMLLLMMMMMMMTTTDDDDDDNDDDDDDDNEVA